MAMTRASDLTNSVVTQYMRDYLLIASKTAEFYGQFVDWGDPIADDGGWGGTLDWPVFGELNPIEDALTEDSDVTPESYSPDYNITLTPAEYGRAVGSTQLAAFQSRAKIRQAVAEAVAQDRVRSIDRIIRRTVHGRGSSYPTNTYFAGTATTMATCDATTDKLTWAWLNELVMRAQALNLEPLDKQGNYAAVVHPSVMYDLMQLTEFTNARYYRDNDTTLFDGEQGAVAGIRFVVTPLARIHLGAGAGVQAATTLAAAYAKGATTITVASGTGLDDGNYITLGTLETESVNPGNNLEQVMIVSGGTTTTLVIRGIGNGTNWGLKYDHASGESVIEAPNVGDITLLGKGSVKGVFASRTGKYGQPKLKTGLDLLDRFVYSGWYWYGGFARVEKYIVNGRFAITKNILGSN